MKYIKAYSLLAHTHVDKSAFLKILLDQLNIEQDI